MDDVAHLIGQPVDQREVAVDRGQVPALEELGRVAGQRADGANGLRQLVCDAGRHLAHHCQLGRLHQLVLGFTQVLLGLDAFGHLAAQALVGLGQGAGAPGHLGFELGIGPLQHVPCRQLVPHETLALRNGQPQQAHEAGRDSGQHAHREGLAAHRVDIGEHPQMPVHLGQRLGLGEHRAAMPGAQALAPYQHAVSGIRAAGALQRLAGSKSAWAVVEVELPDLEVHHPVQPLVADALIEPLGARRQDDDLVVVCDEGGHAQHRPGLGHGGQRDLDHRHTDHTSLIPNRVGQVIARLLAGVADGEVAPHLPGQRLDEIGAEGQVFADKAQGLAGVAGRDHEPPLVDHVHRHAAQLRIELAQKAVDGVGRRRTAAWLQQRHHVAIELDGGWHVFQPVEHAFQRRGKQVQSVVGVGAHAGQPLVP
nr:hypothetical protein [uncultured Aquabacterium sp.]